MNQNGQQSTGTPDANKMKRTTGRSTSDILSTELAPAVDMKPGQYPATFIKWSDETFFLPSKFHAQGVQECIEAYFAVRNTAPDIEPEDSVRILRILLPVPSKQIHPMSNIYKILKPLSGSNEKLWDDRRDNIRAGVKLGDFSGSTCFVVVEEGKKGFSNITGVNLAPVGVSAPYPSMEEGLAAILKQDQEQGELSEEARAGARVPF